VGKKDRQTTNPIDERNDRDTGRQADGETDKQTERQIITNMKEK
jgi:hypothetical protein